MEHRSHRRAHPDLTLVAPFSKNLVQVENGVRHDAQAVPDLPVVVLQSESHFQHAIGFDEAGDHLQAIAAVKLEDEGFVREGELDDMRPAAFLADPECRLGLRIKPGDPRRKNLVSRRLALGFCFGDMNAVR